MESIKENYLERFTENISKKVEKNKDNYNISGRDKEAELTILSLMLRGKSNPLLIGKAGVGKTAIVELITKQILNNDVPEQLKGKEILSLEMSALKDTSDGEGLESKFRKLLNELKANNGKYILFIDETHTLLNSGDAGNVIKPVMARGEVQLIGATTIQEYHQNIEKDKALERRFQLINVDEPTPEVTNQILTNIKNTYQKHYGVIYTKKIIKLCINISVKYLTSRNLPDKAIDVLDQSGALSAYNQEKIVTEEIVYQVINRMTNIPVGKLTEADEKLPEELPKNLSKRVKGQKEAILSVSDAIIMNKASLNDPKRPIASYVFLGTTGVGKTELAKALTEELFGDEDNYIRYNMSEFKTKDDIKTFRIRLTEEVKHKQFAVLLFDEMEKANQDIMDLYLQILDDGILTDEYGNEANFKNCVIIFTTNLGAEFIKDTSRKSKDMTDKHNRDVLNQQIEDELRNNLKPELVNRIDRKILFNMLTKDNALEITKKSVDKEIKKINYNYPNVKINLISKDEKHIDDLYTYILRIGYDRDNGARPINRTIRDYFLTPISEQLLKYSLKNDNLVIDVEVVGKPANSNDIRSTQKLKFSTYTLK